MSQFRPNQKVMVREDAEYVPAELRGQEGIYMCLDPSQVGIRKAGESYDGTDDSGPRGFVQFLDIGVQRAVPEDWLIAKEE